MALIREMIPAYIKRFRNKAVINSLTIHLFCPILVGNFNKLSLIIQKKYEEFSDKETILKKES
jgi:hypothetical protein